MTAESEGSEFIIKIIGMVIAFGVVITLILFFAPQTPGWVADALKTAANVFKIFGA